MIRTWMKFAESGVLALTIPDRHEDREMLAAMVALIAVADALNVCVRVGHLPAPTGVKR